MSKLTVKRIKNFLDKHFEGKIDLSNLHPKCSEKDREKQFRSRALAAYALTVVASAETEDAVNSITDGFNDNGIDAIYYDKASNNLWLVQAKFIEKGRGGIDTGDIEKFNKGIKRLINEKYSKFNDRVKDRQEEIAEALEDYRVKIQLLLAYTGDNLSSHNMESIDDFIREQNDTEELIHFNDFNIDKAYKGLVIGVSSTPINEDFLISNWGHIDEPLKSYYGQIAGSDLAALWEEYGTRLFAKNIRSFLGNSSVNDDIRKTIIEEPENFIYFNNGITVLCESINKKPQGGADKSIGAFSCQGLSVVNGAQTFGTISSFYNNKEVDLSRVKVFIKFISLEGSVEGFGERITVATNTQNKVDRKDFVSLDKQQERVKIELKLENIDYHYKRTDELVIPDEQNYTLEEVAFSLACLWENIDYSTIVKKQSGKLWEDPHQKPYIDLFNNNVSALKIIKAVKIYRAVTSKMNHLAKESSGRDRSIYKYGNAFVTHITCQAIPKEYWADSNSAFDHFFSDNVMGMIDSNIDKLHTLIETEYPDSMIVYVLRNFSKIRNLKELMLEQDSLEILNA